jgi:hypothetical protein
MKSRGRKIRNSVRGRQKQDIKLIVFISTCGVAIIVLFTTLLNFSSVHKAKAQDFEIRQLEEQIFTTEMSIPSPVINGGKKANSNTIFIQQRKQTNSPAQ